MNFINLKIEIPPYRDTRLPPRSYQKPRDKISLYDLMALEFISYVVIHKTFQIPVPDPRYAKFIAKSEKISQMMEFPEDPTYPRLV